MIEKMYKSMLRTREDVLKEQEYKFRMLVKHAFYNSKYYRNAFLKAGINEGNLMTCPVNKFPTMDKNILMDNYKDILVVPEDFSQEELRVYDESGEPGLFLDKYHVVHSSGTTGTPKYFIYDQEAWQAAMFYALRAAFSSFTPGQIAEIANSEARLLYIAATGGAFGGAVIVSAGVSGFNAKQENIDINDPLESWLKKYNEFKPNIIMGYPTALKIMADQLMANGEVLPVKHIITTGELLDGSMRNYLESVFKASITNLYAANECMVLGVENSNEQGMIIFDDANMVEVIDGKIYVTNLFNYSQPLIRYRFTDSLRFIKKDDPSYRLPFSRARVMHGREEDTIWFTDNEGKKDFLHPMVLEDFCFPGLVDYQIIQNSEQSFYANLEIMGNEEHRKMVLRGLGSAIKRVLEEHNLSYVDYELNVVDKILPDPKTGKKKLTVPYVRE